MEQPRDVRVESEANTDFESGPSTSQLKNLFKELLAETKNDILTQVKFGKIYTDFDTIALDNEAEGSIAGISDPGLTDKIDNFVQVVQPEHAEKVLQNQDFQALAEEFSVLERTSAPISAGLADIVNGLLKDKLTKEKLHELQPKYVRPENCPNLVPPKVNKQIWQQMLQDTRNGDSAFQKAQGLMISGLCAVLEVCNSAIGDQKGILVHSAVLLLAANREFNLKRRDLIRPDLNKQYGSLCNPSVAISTHLFGDDLNKEVEEVTKSNKLSSKFTSKPLSDYRVEPYQLSSGKDIRGCGRFHQTAGRGITRSFFSTGRGQTRPPFKTSYNETQ